MNTKLPRAGTMNTAQRAVPSAPPHISVHCKAVKGTSAQAKLLPKTHRPPVAPPVQRAKPPVFTAPKAVQPKMATALQVKRTPALPTKPAIQRAIRPTAIRPAIRPAIQLARPVGVGPARAVIQRMEEVVRSESSLVIPSVSYSSSSLLTVTRDRDGAVITVTHDNEKDQLNGVYTQGLKTIVGSHITYACYSKGNELPDGTIAPENFCHQGYIHTAESIRRQGIAYVLAYAGARYANTQLGQTRVSTNLPNMHSGTLALRLGFSKSHDIQILSAVSVIQQAAIGMRNYGWRVSGGSLAPSSSISGSSSSRTVSDRTRLLDDDQPKSKWSCCFLTTAVCRWRGLPDDCEELTLLRRYRDTYLRNSETGVSAVEHYYEIAPSIATAINEDPYAKTIYDWIYEVVHRCIAAIKREDYDSAFEHYKQMVLDLEDHYLGQKQ